MPEIDAEELTIGQLEQGMPIEFSKETLQYTHILEDPLRLDPKTGSYARISPTPTQGLVHSIYPSDGAVWYFPMREDIGEFHPKPVTVVVSRYCKVKYLTGAEGKKLISVWEKEQVKNPGTSYENSLYCSSGTDPEVFVELKGNLLPAWEFLPKDDEWKPEQHWDGFAAEWRTRSDTCLQVLHDRVRSGMSRVLKVAQSKFPEAKLSVKSTVEIPRELLRALPEDKVTFGCRPSLNAYGAEPVNLGNPRDITMRTAGGHVHFGSSYLNKADEARIAKIIKKIDAFAGVASVGLMEGLDDPARRKLYGQAGEYRRTSYGLEYRVLSNGWLRHPSLYHLTFELVRIGLNLGWDEIVGKFWNASEGEVRECICSGDVKSARAIIERNKKMFKNCVTNAIHAGDKKANADAAYKAVMEGIGSFLKYPDDIEKNWQLESAPTGKKNEWEDGEDGAELDYYERIHEWGTAATSILQNKKI